MSSPPFGNKNIWLLGYSLEIELSMPQNSSVKENNTIELQSLVLTKNVFSPCKSVGIAPPFVMYVNCVSVFVAHCFAARVGDDSNLLSP